MAGYIKRLLVIGDNHQEKVEKYSLETKKEPYILHRKEDLQSIWNYMTSLLENVLNDNKILNISSTQYNKYEKLYNKIYHMSAIETILLIEKDSYADKEGNILSTINDNAKYKTASCYQNKFLKYNIESEFTTPFILKNGNKSYSAHLNEIEWDKIHKTLEPVYQRIWEMAMEGSSPKNELEKELNEKGMKHFTYYMSFDDKDDFVKHVSWFYTNAYITENGEYVEKRFDMIEKEWIEKYMDTVIYPLKERNPLITLYEMRGLRD